MNRMDALTARRREARHDVAAAAVARIREAAARHGIEVTIIGSLARGDFRVHSDVDLLVRGPVDPARRGLAERLVADGMRATAIPYDLVFEEDLTGDRLQEMLCDQV